MNYKEQFNLKREIMLRGIVFLFGLFTLSYDASAAATIRGTVGPSGATVYQSSSTGSKVLGKYPANTPVTIYPSPRNGFYPIYVGKNAGTGGYVWITEGELVMPQGAGAQTNGKSVTDASGRRKKASGPVQFDRPNNVIRIGITAYDFSPSNLQTALGGTSAGFFSIGFNLGYERQVSKKFSILSSLDRYSFSQTLSGGGTLPMVYSVSGWGFSLGGAYRFYENGHWLLSGIGMIGVSMNSVGNSNSALAISTSDILAIPILIAVMGEYSFSNSFGAYLRLGYQIQSLSAVPVLPATGMQTSSDISLSAIVTTIGASYRF